MDTLDYGKSMGTKLIAWIDGITKKIARRGSEESENVLTRTRDMNVHRTESKYRIRKLESGPQGEWNAWEKGIGKGSVDVRGKYVLRPRLSWTGLYGKEPWPRERKQWEKV
jgi:hypothetical protein